MEMSEQCRGSVQSSSENGNKCSELQRLSLYWVVGLRGQGFGAMEGLV